MSVGSRPSPRSPLDRLGVLGVLLGVVWLSAVAVAVRFDAAYDLPRWGRAILWVGLICSGAAVWTLRGSRPGRPKPRVLVMGLLACGLTVASLMFVPAAAGRVRRVAAPWSSAPAEPPAYRLVVSSGDVILARGQGVTLAAYLDCVAPTGDWPGEATLTLTPNAGPPQTVTLRADETAAFTHTLPRADAGFTYRLRVGPIESPSYTVSVVEPVGLLPTSAVTVYPPDYARATTAPSRHAGIPAGVSGLERSLVALELHFDRRPAALTATWTPTGGAATPLAAPLDHESPTARVKWLATESGRIRVSAGEEPQPSWVLAIEVAPDRPPVCAPVLGWSAPSREARPDDRLLLDLALTDDAGVALVELQYTRNASATVETEALRLPGLGSRRVEGLALVPLRGKVVAGDVLRARLVVSDNRHDAAGRPAPNRTLLPAQGWVEFRITPTARPLWEQGTVERRARLRDLFERSEARCRAALDEVAAVQADPAEGLTFDQRLRLGRAVESLDEADALAPAVAADLGDGPDFQALGRRVEAEGLRPQRGAAASLKSLLAATELGAKSATLEAVHGQLTGAATAWREVRPEVTLRTERRLAAQQLRVLAAEIAGADTPTDVAERQRTLAAWRDQVAGLVGTNAVLRQAVAADANRQLRQLSGRLVALARDFRLLDDAARATAFALRQDRLGAALGKLTPLAARAESLLAEVATAARTQGLPGFTPKALTTARDELLAGRGLECLTELEKVAGELDRVATRFEGVRRARAEPREYYRQLARVEDDLHRRAGDAPGGLTPAARAHLHAEQRLLRERLAECAPGPEEATGTLFAIGTRSVDDAVCILAEQGLDPLPPLAKAARALHELADGTMSPEQRLRAAASALERDRRELESLAREFDTLARGTDPTAFAVNAKALEPLAKRLAGLALGVSREGPASKPAVQDRLRRAFADAEECLRAGFVADAPIRFESIRRELEAQAQRARGQVPASEMARQLAAEQCRITERVVGGVDPASLAVEQREVGRRLALLPTPGATGLSVAAQDRSRELEVALRQPTPGKAALAAREAVTALARRLSGEETDNERLQRLLRDWSGAPSEGAAEVGRRAQRLVEELEQTAAGPAVLARRQALEAFQRLRGAGEPDRQAALQQAAREALARFAAEVAQWPGARHSLTFHGPHEASAAERRQATDFSGLWPEARHGQELAALAVRVREVRDQVSLAVTDAARWPKTRGEDRYAALAARLDEVGRSESPDLASLVDQARAALLVGDGARALRLLASADERSKGAEAKLRELRGELGGLSGDAVAALTRQTARLVELHADFVAIAGGLNALAPRQSEATRLDADSPFRRTQTLVEQTRDRWPVTLAHAQAGRAETAETSRRELRAGLRAIAFWAARMAPAGSLTARDAEVGRGLSEATEAMEHAHAKMAPEIQESVAAAIRRAASALVSELP